MEYKLSEINAVFCFQVDGISGGSLGWKDALFHQHEIMGPRIMNVEA